MTRGTITNKQTGLEITGTMSGEKSGALAFNVEGTTGPVYLHAHEWDFTPEPEPIKDGVYAYTTARPEEVTIRKYRAGKWRDADGYELNDQKVDVSRLVRLVPEA